MEIGKLLHDPPPGSFRLFAGFLLDQPSFDDGLESQAQHRCPLCQRNGDMSSAADAVDIVSQISVCSMGFGGFPVLGFPKFTRNFKEERDFSEPSLFRFH